jgi:hypothetical protein
VTIVTDEQETVGTRSVESSLSLLAEPTTRTGLSERRVEGREEIARGLRDELDRRSGLSLSHERTFRLRDIVVR